MFQGKKKTSKSTQRRPKNNSKSYSISTSAFRSPTKIPITAEIEQDYRAEK